MTKRVFYLFSYILLFFIISTTIISIILTKHQLLEYIADKYIKSYGIEYQTVQGSLLSNITLKNVKYKDIFKAKELHVSYFLPQLFSKTPTISTLSINNGDIYPLYLKKDSKNSTSLYPFAISKTVLKHLKIHLKDKNLSIDTKAIDIKYDKKISIKDIKLSAKTEDRYGVFLKGRVDRDIFRGNGELSSKEIKPYLKALPFKIEADTKHIFITSYIKSLKISPVWIKDINLTADYSLKNNRADFNATYLLSNKSYNLFIKQKGYINKEQKFISTISVDINNTPLKFPFKHIKALLKADKKNITLKIDSNSLKCDIKGDYRRFEIVANTLYRGHKIDSNSTLLVSPLLLSGRATIKDGINFFKLRYKLNKTTLDLKASMQKNGHTIKFIANSKNVDYKNFVAKDLNISFFVPNYVKIITKGDYEKGVYLANAKWYIDKKYLKFFSYTPSIFTSKIKLTKNSIELFSNIDKLVAKNISFQNFDIKLCYPFAKKVIDINSSYILQKDNNQIKITQSTKASLQGDFNSSLNATILHSNIKLPFQDVKAYIKGSAKQISLKGGAKNYKFMANSNYKKLHLKVVSKKASFNFLNIPDIFKDKKTDITSVADINFTPFYIKGKASAKNSLGLFKVKYKIDKQSSLARVKFMPDKNYKLFKEYNISNFAPSNITLYSDIDSKVLNIDAKMLNVTLFKEKKQLGGWGNLSSTYFDIKGGIKKDKTISLDINAALESLKKFLKDSGIFKSKQKFYIDAKAIISSKLIISNNIIFSSRVKMPWFIINLDKDKFYKGKDFSLQFSLKNFDAFIDRYSFYLQNHYIYANKPSKLSFLKNGDVIFKKFYIFDNLTLKGKANIFKKECNLNLKGKNFHYISKEADINANADINIKIKPNGEQKFSGKIVLLKGVLHIKPKEEYNLIDNDIVIIQNLHANRTLKRKINIFVEAKNPISYEIKDVKLKFIPDFLIYQEEGNAIEYLGMVTITKGSVVKSGKKFILKKSRIYLRGATPLNPYLNLHFIYKIPNDITIKVFIENTLASPLIILSSNPPMSQNDIMSYILFGKPANSALVFDKNSRASIPLNSLLYGVGLKKMFQDTTHINIDTINILTSKDKRFGYEIGLSLNDRVRVIYKNDEVSTIIIQYSLNRHIQINVNVKQSAEGVNLLYTKEF